MSRRKLFLLFLLSTVLKGVLMKSKTNTTAPKSKRKILERSRTLKYIFPDLVQALQ